RQRRRIPLRQLAAAGWPRAYVDSAHVANLAIARVGSTACSRCRRTLTKRPVSSGASLHDCALLSSHRAVMVDLRRLEVLHRA
ncbi:MAG: hypothetical protein ACK58T_09860, partial [Phycisphaerae bacterium]